MDAPRHNDRRREKYITPDYLKRSMHRLCFFKDFPLNKIIQEDRLQPILDKWEACNGFVPNQLYALRHYYSFRAKFIELGVWDNKEATQPGDFVFPKA